MHIYIYRCRRCSATIGFWCGGSSRRCSSTPSWRTTRRTPCSCSRVRKRMRACVRACERACMRAWVRAQTHPHARTRKTNAHTRMHVHTRAHARTRQRVRCRRRGHLSGPFRQRQPLRSRPPTSAPGLAGWAHPAHIDLRSEARAALPARVDELVPHPPARAPRVRRQAVEADVSSLPQPPPPPAPFPSPYTRTPAAATPPSRPPRPLEGVQRPAVVAGASRIDCLCVFVCARRERVARGRTASQVLQPALRDRDRRLPREQVPPPPARREYSSTLFRLPGPP